MQKDNSTQHDGCKHASATRPRSPGIASANPPIGLRNSEINSVNSDIRPRNALVRPGHPGIERDITGTDETNGAIACERLNVRIKLKNNSSETIEGIPSIDTVDVLVDSSWSPSVQILSSDIRACLTPPSSQRLNSGDLQLEVVSTPLGDIFSQPALPRGSGSGYGVGVDLDTLLLYDGVTWQSDGPWVALLTEILHCMFSGICLLKMVDSFGICRQ